jgi:hypothetical protein
MDVAAQGLSFDATKKLCYLVPSRANMGTREAPKWETRATLQISPYGELAIRQMVGQIQGCDAPVVVYHGDHFECGNGPQGKYVDYKLKTTHSTEITACFMRIIKKDGTIDFFWLLKEDILRLKGYSEKKNNGTANALYTSVNGSIDPGFLRAKTIKHAFYAYPKVKVGAFTTIQEDPEDEAPLVDYGFHVEAPAAVVQEPATEEPITPHTVIPDEDF